MSIMPIKKPAAMNVTVEWGEFEAICDVLDEKRVAYSLDRCKNPNRVWKFVVEGTVCGETMFSDEEVSLLVLDILALSRQLEGETP